MKFFKTLLAAAIACSLFYTINPETKTSVSENEVPCVKQQTALLNPGYTKSQVFTDLIPSDSKNTLVLCTDGSGALYDTILIVSHSKKENKLCVTSLPRDIYVPYNEEICNQLDQLGLFTQKGIFKLNATGSIGKLIHHKSNRFEHSEMAFMADILQEMTGIAVQEYAIVGFETFKKLVDTVGGVTVNVACDIRTSEGTLLLPKGSQKLDGTQALIYARTRKFYDENGNTIPSGGDHTRKAHQLAMIQEVIPQLTQKSALAKLPQMIGILRKDVRHSFSIAEMYKYYRLAQDVSSGKITLETNLITGRVIDPFHDGCAYLEFE